MEATGFEGRYRQAEIFHLEFFTDIIKGTGTLGYNQENRIMELINR
jgi:hypothetical protein